MKIVVVSLGVPSHVNPTLNVGAELVRQGAQVTFVTTRKFEESVRAIGASFVASNPESIGVKPVSATVARPRLSPAEMFAAFPARLVQHALSTVPQIETAVRALRPDLIVYERMALAGRILPRVLGVPAAQLSTTYVGNRSFSLADFYDPTHPALGAFRTAAEAMAARYGGLPITLSELHSSAEPLNIVFMPRSFQYAGETFDENSYVFVGPSLDRVPSEGAVRAEGAAPLLYVSMGSAYDFHTWPEFFRACIEAFADQPLRVVMVVGKGVDVSAVGPAPANFQVTPYACQLEVLSQASAFITHGGMNSAQEALYFKTPMVVIPQTPEQSATARRVRELGLGTALTRETTSVSALRREVEDVMASDDIRRRLEMMQRDCRAAGGARRAAQALLAHAHSPGRGRGNALTDGDHVVRSAAGAFSGDPRRQTKTPQPFERDRRSFLGENFGENEKETGR